LSIIFCIREKISVNLSNQPNQWSKKSYRK
jgi:hypothetical protein